MKKNIIDGSWLLVSIVLLTLAIFVPLRRKSKSEMKKIIINEIWLLTSIVLLTLAIVFIWTGGKF